MGLLRVAAIGLGAYGLYRVAGWTGALSAVSGRKVPLPAGSFRITSRFGPRINPVTKLPQNHDRIDLAAPQGTPITAVEAGEVVRIDSAASGGNNGNAVHIRTPGGYVWSYLHMVGAPAVKVGQRVSGGDVLGAVGSTGRSTGPHLHLQVGTGSGWTPIDPESLLPELTGLALMQTGGTGGTGQGTDPLWRHYDGSDLRRNW